MASAEALMHAQELAVRWFTQPASPRTFQARSNGELSDLQVEQLAFDLSQTCVAFEITQSSSDPALFLFDGNLGLTRLALDQAGEPVFRLGQVEHFLERSNGSLKEFQRLLRVSSGQAWLDRLEPLRAGSLGLEGLRKVG